MSAKPHIKMPDHKRIPMLLGLAFAVIYWCAETLIHTFIFKEGPLLREFIPLYSCHELWMRIFTAFLFILLGFVMFYLLEKLQKEHGKVVELKQIIPMCGRCKKVRDKDGNWQRVEDFMSQNMDTSCSTGYCPECFAVEFRDANIDIEDIFGPKPDS